MFLLENTQTYLVSTYTVLICIITRFILRQTRLLFRLSLSTAISRRCNHVWATFCKRSAAIRSNAA